MPRNNPLFGFWFQPPKLGVARSNRARVTIFLFWAAPRSSGSFFGDDRLPNCSGIIRSPPVPGRCSSLVVSVRLGNAWRFFSCDSINNSAYSLSIPCRFLPARASPSHPPPSSHARKPEADEESGGGFGNGETAAISAPVQRRRGAATARLADYVTRGRLREAKARIV